MTTTTTPSAPAIAGHQNALDGIRAVAALAVLVLHVGAQSGLLNNSGAVALLVSRGDVGVPLFFALSGLLLYRPWARAALAAPDRSTFGQSARRGFPAFWIVVIYVMVAVVVYVDRPAMLVVPVFFAVLGVLIYRLWTYGKPGVHGDDPRVGLYLWKRFLRVLPAYWIVVVYALIVYVAYANAPATREHGNDIWTWFKMFTLTYIYDGSPWWGNYLGPQGLGQMWSLTAELGFYVTLPFVAWVLALGTRGGRDLAARGRRLLYGIAVYGSISFVYSIFIFYPEDRPQIGLWLPRNLTWFAVGMALSTLTVWARLEAGEDGPVKRFCRTVASSWATCWTCAGLLYCISSTPLTGPLGFSSVDVLWTAEIRLALYALISAFVIAPAAFASGQYGAPVYSILGNRVMRFLGKISYSVFLWQIAVLIGFYDLTDQSFGTGNFFVAFPVTVSVTIILSYLTYRLVEEPSRHLLRFVT